MAIFGETKKSDCLSSFWDRWSPDNVLWKCVKFAIYWLVLYLLVCIMVYIILLFIWFIFYAILSGFMAYSFRSSNTTSQPTAKRR